jgi:2-methylcitrate dehydratase PrpD
MHETCNLAQFVAQIQFADLPSSLIDASTIAVLDTFGAGFVGVLQPWAQQVVALVRACGGIFEASVIPQAWQTDISSMELANGALIGAFECEPLNGVACQRQGVSGRASSRF